MLHVMDMRPDLQNIRMQDPYNACLTILTEVLLRGEDDTSAARSSAAAWSSP